MLQPWNHCWVHVIVTNSMRANLENPHWTCNYCHENYSGRDSRIKAHLKHIWSHAIGACTNVPGAVRAHYALPIPPVV